MANKVWHVALDIVIDLALDDLGYPNIPTLWETLYAADRLYATRHVPLSERGLRCGGVCKDAGVVAWMYLRERNGRREAVHERREDEERHAAPMTDEHKAYQERIVRVAQQEGFQADSEVRTSIGSRGWIQTDTLVQSNDGRCIGWEIQLSSVGHNGPRSVRARATKARKHGITPAWHTDRPDYARRNDTQWTRSNNLPAHVIAKIGDLRVVSGFRVLDFWRCDVHALYRCPDTQSRCGRTHITPKPRDILFDDLVRKTAAGLVVPIEHRHGRLIHRFWVTRTDRDRHHDLLGDVAAVRPEESRHPQRGRSAAPTCSSLPPTAATVVPAQCGIAGVLDWSSDDHWSDEQRPCQHCGGPTNLRDDDRKPSHKVCAETRRSP
ncbi:hypothetical protein AB0C96_39065 [Streptomyces sp. NPDC048506]|uniref:hypothetical protein n=1 Tax=Streptomyces sp. NPDC048506 TaxID=3155028 RepID=UPI003434D7C4